MMQTPLQASQGRLQSLRALTTAALGRMLEGEMQRALTLAEAALSRAEGIKVAYGADEQALDSLVSALAVCLQVIVEDPRHRLLRQPVRTMLERAVQARLRGLRGEGEEA
jgi:hypothetical protein